MKASRPTERAMATGGPIDPHEGNWLAPSELARRRVVERAGALDLAVRVSGGLAGLVLLLTAIFRDAWALVPLGVLVVGVLVGPTAVRRGARPEYADFVIGNWIMFSIAACAGAIGDLASPVTYLLPIGVVMNALRGVPASIVFGSVGTALVFLGASLIADSGAVTGEPLPMLAILATLAATTVGCITLAGAEISYRRASVIDPLTGLLNRQGLEDRFEELRQQALVSDSPISFILFDLDHFKQINDRHGHDVGDDLLREVAYQVRKSLRRFELVYRIGGEEFLVLLPGLSECEGSATAEQLRAAVDRVRLRSEIGVTASFGVSGANGEAVDFEHLYRSADRALYEAKRGGRDQVWTAAGSAVVV